jgi:hypothetical protein
LFFAAALFGPDAQGEPSFYRCIAMVGTKIGVFFEEVF